MNVTDTVGIASGAVVVGGASVAILRRSWWRLKKLHRRFTAWRRSGILEVMASLMDTKLAEQDARSVTIAERVEQRLIEERGLNHKEITEALNVVTTEMSFNGGGSIKDAVRRIDHRTLETAAGITAIDGKMEGVISRLDAGVERSRVAEGRLDRIEEKVDKTHTATLVTDAGEVTFSSFSEAKPR